MKKFLIRITWGLGMYTTYKIALWSIILFGNKLPIHDDLGEIGQNQTVVLGSSNAYFSYDYQLWNSYSEKKVRTCWIPASYGVGLNLYKYNQIIQKGDHLLIEFPYHWYLFDQMAPHNYSFYSRATTSFFSFFFKTFPIDFVGHLCRYSVFEKDWWIYQKKQFSFKEEKQNFNHLIQKIDADSSYFKCSLDKYSQKNHFVQATTFQKFQFQKIVDHFEDLKKKYSLKINMNFPPMEKGNFVVNPEIIQNIKNAYPTLIQFNESIWPHKYQYDQRYHLNACGAKLNTMRISKKLDSAID